MYFKAVNLSTWYILLKLTVKIFNIYFHVCMQFIFNMYNVIKEKLES